MILNVIQVSRAETSELLTYFEDLELSRVAKDVAEAFRSAAEVDGRSVRVEVPGELPIRRDETHIRRVLQDLIRNALCHTPPGTHVIVRLSARMGERVRLSVVDDGPGIPKSVQASLFGPFGTATLRKAGVRVDTGLGLLSGRVMARAISADLEVESDSQRGTTFSLVLPRRRPD